jgi:hypothetical protein
MAQSARDNRISRRSWLMAGLAIPLLRLQADEGLTVSFDGDNLHFTAPGLHFLTGKPLTRLKDADTVTFLSQITLFSDDQGTIFRRGLPERLVVSYDLWEERFKVTIPGASRSRSNLTALEAEAWAIENLAISALGLAPDRPFWMRFELRAASPKEMSRVMGDSGISLSGLVEILSRKPGVDDPYWMRSAGPLRLSDLPRTVARRGRIG